MVAVATEVLAAPSATPGAPSSAGHRRDIQGLRAVAVLLVIGYHAGLPIPGGFAGVDVFFVISGFVITSMLQREWRSTGRLQLGRFYLRRFRRLTPALAVLVTLVVPMSLLLTSPIATLERTALTGAGAVLMLANFVLNRLTDGYFTRTADTNPLLHTWSLSVEEQFYLVFPAVLALCWLIQRRFKPRLAPWLIGAVVVVSFVAAVTTPDPVHDFFSPFQRAWEFAAGALLAVAFTSTRHLSQRMALSLAGIGVLALALTAVLVSEQDPFPGWWTLLPVGGAAALIVAGSQAGNPVSRALSGRIPVAIGDASYSLYLWHWPPIVFAAAAWPGDEGAKLAAASLSVVPAVLSYRLVETRCRRVPDRPGAIVRLGEATMVPALAASILVFVIAMDGLGDPLVRRFQEEAGAQHVITTTCTGQSGWRPKECAWNSEASGEPIYLVGDSVAEQYSGPIVTVSTRLNRPLTALTHPGCPLVDGQLWNPQVLEDENRECQQYVQRLLDHLGGARPGLVVLAASDRYLVTDGVGFGPSPDRVVSDPASRMSAWTRATESAVLRLQKAGHRVILVRPTPRWDQSVHWSPATCTGLDRILGDDANWCRAQIARGDAEANQASGLSAVAQVSSRTGATIFDPWMTLCPDGVCSTATNVLLRYRDTEHITAEQSLLLAPAFKAAVTAAG